MRPDLAALLRQPIAHRGLHDRARGRIENSLGAADAAIAAGFGIECDVRGAGDGEPMVFHDETLERLTAGSGPLDAQAGAALTTLPLRDSDPPETIPTLAMLLRRIGGRVPLVIELKSRFRGDGPLADRTLAVLAGYRGPVGLKSFDPALVARCKALGAAWPLGRVGPAERSADVPFDESAVDFLSWHVDDLAALRARAPTMPLMSWTIRTPAQALAARRHGAQIVFERFRPIGFGEPLTTPFEIRAP